MDKRNRRVFATEDPPASVIGPAAIRHLRAHLHGVGQAWLLRRATKPSGTLLLRIIPIIFELGPSTHPPPACFRLSYAQTHSAAGAGCAWLLTAEDRPVAAGWRWSASPLKPKELQIYQALRDGARYLRRLERGRCALEITGPNRLVAAHLNGQDTGKLRCVRAWRQGLTDRLRHFEYRGTLSDSAHMRLIAAAAEASTSTTSFLWSARPPTLHPTPDRFPSGPPLPPTADASPLIAVSRTYTSVKLRAA